MKTHFSHTFINTVLRLVTRIEPQTEPLPSSTPEHVMRRLESVFEALGALSEQQDIAAALDLACDTLQAELPNAATAAGLYDIDTDAIRVVAARGLEHDLLRGTVLSRERCFGGCSGQEAVVTGGADWIGEGDQGDGTVLLCPILHDANLLGVIALAEPLCTAHFDRHDVELVSYVAEQLAAFIQVRRHRAAAAVPEPARSSA